MNVSDLRSKCLNECSYEITNAEEFLVFSTFTVHYSECHGGHECEHKEYNEEWDRLKDNSNKCVNEDAV